MEPIPCRLDQLERWPLEQQSIHILNNPIQDHWDWLPHRGGSCVQRLLGVLVESLHIDFHVCIQITTHPMSLSAPPPNPMFMSLPSPLLSLSLLNKLIMFLSRLPQPLLILFSLLLVKAFLLFSLLLSPTHYFLSLLLGKAFSLLLPLLGKAFSLLLSLLGKAFSLLTVLP
jgi:hypothetical protein